MRLKTASIAVIATASLAVAAAAPAGASAQVICVSTTQDVGTICSDQVVPIVKNRVACAEGYLATEGPLAAARCVPYVDRLIDP